MSNSDAVKAVLDEMVGGMAGVNIDRAFGYPAYYSGDKVFCFVRDEGVVLKLNPERVEALVKQGGNLAIYHPNDGIGRVWKSWLLISGGPDAVKGQKSLFEESAKMVAAEPKKEKKPRRKKKK